jgi:hypothetical protein
MATGRPRILAFWIALPLITVGCAGPNPFTQRQTTMGSLKASVSQLEFENEKLRREVGELKADNSRLDNQLVQESQANGELSARLDDAKDLIRREGGGTTASSSFEEDIPPPAQVTPKARRTRNSRTSPSVSIPRPDAPPADDDLSFQSSSRTPRDLGPNDELDNEPWLPVARGLPSAVTIRK